MTQRAVLLANLGSPDAPDVPSVRRYLNQFLMDPFVIQLPWLLRRLVVSLFVLPKRPKDSAEAYESIWWEEGSPLVVLSKRLQSALQKRVDFPTAMAMRYGNPSIESQLLSLVNEHKAKEIFFLPLYPHYADSTVTTSIVEAQRVVHEHELDVKLNVLPVFYEQPDYIEALYQSLVPYLGDTSNNNDTNPYDHIVFSYHGLPESHLKKADPTQSHCLMVEDCCNKPSNAHATCYRHQVMRTTKHVVERAGLSEDEYSVAFQSRLGRAVWLGPSTDETLKQLAARGVKRVLVVCPAFVTDCLETLEEIATQGKEDFIEAGGEDLKLVPCLNTQDVWLDVLEKWCSTAVAGE